MPKIEIFERDETLAGESASSTDVVFVPGFANTNANCYVLNSFGETPNNLEYPGQTTPKDSKGQYELANSTNINKFGADWGEFCPSQQYPMYATNIVSEETWFFNENNEWVKDYIGSDGKTVEQIYVAPSPENVAVLCTSLEEFTSNFGTTPYKFASEQDVSDLFDSEATANVSAMYQAGDYERSYIYAKELVRAGLPVIYQNIVERKADGKIEQYDTSATLVRDGNPIALNVENKIFERAYVESKEKSKGDQKGKNFVFTYVESTSKNVTKGWQLDGKYIEGNIESIFGKAIFNPNYEPTNGDILTLAVNSEMTTIAEKNQKAPCNVRYLYANLSDCYYKENQDVPTIQDKGEYTVKYITTGAYPTYEMVDTYTITKAMMQCASERGDAVAIIDAYNNPQRTFSATSGSVYAKITSGAGISKEYDSYATMFGPAWNIQNCLTAPKGATKQIMPPSFSYLATLADSIKTNANWMAIAGVNRGQVSGIVSVNSVYKMTNTLADAYQPRDNRAINTITNIRPYGLCIWGNRTLLNNAEKGNLTALSFLNIRNMVSDIKKVAYTAAKSLIFEQNTEIMWNRFKTQIIPTLERMVHGYGLSSYDIIKATKHQDGTALAKGQVAAVIRLYPIYAIEDFEITVVMSDEGVTVE